MLEGKPPFKAGSEYLTFEKILALDYQIPDHFSEAAKSIVQSLLRTDPHARLGVSFPPSAHNFLLANGSKLQLHSMLPVSCLDLTSRVRAACRHLI